MPWCKNRNIVKQVKQVDLANLLLPVAIYSGAPSIWLLPIVQEILRHPAAQRIFIEQGMLGARSRKPTHLLTVSLPSIRNYVKRLRRLPDKPWIAFEAHDGVGHFKTVRAKEYPGRRCFAVRDFVVSRSFVDKAIDGGLRETVMLYYVPQGPYFETEVCEDRTPVQRIYWQQGFRVWKLCLVVR